MERAASACVKFLTNHYAETTHFYIYCGTGNNGGDGFAIARLLYQKSFDVDVFYDADTDSFSPEATLNFNRLREYSGIGIQNFEQAEKTSFAENSVVIDALFGSGLNRGIEGRAAELIEYLNHLSFPKVAIDIPSGLYVDRISDGCIFKADVTLSFQFWKRAFLHPETGKYCGRVVILDIGLIKAFFSNIKSPYQNLDLEKIQEIYRPREAFSHKGTYGKSLLIAGSFGKIGAAVLATKAATKTGSGLTFCMAPRCGYEILQTACPEAMFLHGGEEYITEINIPPDVTVGIGPGLGIRAETKQAFVDFLKKVGIPSVFDADALNILAATPEALNSLPENSLLTPHPKEFERLFGKTDNSFQRLEKAREVSRKYNILLVLKDRFTQIVFPDGQVFYNTAGNAGMAKGGSGDVLTGILTALLAQNYSPASAALFGVWLHSTAADLAAQEVAEESLLASDIIEGISGAYQLLKKTKNAQ